MKHYLPILMVATWVVGFFYLFHLLSRMVRPKRQRTSIGKTEHSSKKPAWLGYRAHLPLAIVIFFGLFFLYPAMIIYRQLAEEGHGVLLFCEIFGFISILSAAFAQLWRRGDLNWKKDEEV